MKLQILEKATALVERLVVTWIAACGGLFPLAHLDTSEERACWWEVFWLIRVVASTRAPERELFACHLVFQLLVKKAKWFPIIPSLGGSQGKVALLDPGITGQAWKLKLL